MSSTCLAPSTLPSSQGQSLSLPAQSCPAWATSPFFGRHNATHTRKPIQCKNHLPSVLVSSVLRSLNEGWSQHNCQLQPLLRQAGDFSSTPVLHEQQPCSSPLNYTQKIIRLRRALDSLSPGLFWPRSAHAEPLLATPGSHSPGSDGECPLPTRAVGREG